MKSVSWPAIGILLLASATVAVTTSNQSADRARLADHGRLTTARIEGKSLRHRNHVTGTLDIAFETADGTATSAKG